VRIPPLTHPLFRLYLWSQRKRKKREKKKLKKNFQCFLMLSLPSTCSSLLGYQSFPSLEYPPMRPSKICSGVPLSSPSKRKERLMRWKRKKILVDQLQQLQSPHHHLTTISKLKTGFFQAWLLSFFQANSCCLLQSEEGWYFDHDPHFEQGEAGGSVGQEFLGPLCKAWIYRRWLSEPTESRVWPIYRF
jgi:hypothetical protein